MPSMPKPPAPRMSKIPAAMRNPVEHVIGRIAARQRGPGPKAVRSLVGKAGHSHQLLVRSNAAPRISGRAIAHGATRGPPRQSVGGEAAGPARPAPQVISEWPAGEPVAANPSATTPASLLITIIISNGRAHHAHKPTRRIRVDHDQRRTKSGQSLGKTESSFKQTVHKDRRRNRRAGKSFDLLAGRRPAASASHWSMECFTASVTWGACSALGA